MTSQSIKLKRFGALMQAAFESGWLLHETFQSVAGFTKVGLFDIWFYVESPDIYIYEFLIWVCEYTMS